MHISSTDLFCDWLTIAQTHAEPHSGINAGTVIFCDEEGNPERVKALPRTLRGKKGSNIQISSDGHTVRFDGNISRHNRSENFSGLDLDACKESINRLLAHNKLPPFDSGVRALVDGKEIDTGARITRLDLTTNLACGSAYNRESVLNFIQTQNHPTLPKQLIGSTTYYGKYSDNRGIRFYDKAGQLRDVTLKKLEREFKKTGSTKLKKEIEYVKKLINYADSNGIIRLEIEFHGFLKNYDCRSWRNAKHLRLCGLFEKEISKMQTETKTMDLEEIPFRYVGTLLAYFAGIDVRKRLSRNAYFRHKKALKEYGYDISNQNIGNIKPKQKTIVLRVADVPDWYRQPELWAPPKTELKSVK